MKEKILVICDDDKTYIDRLGRYINSRKSRDLSVACFSDRDKLAEYAKENGFETIRIDTGTSNVPAQKMYEKIGFERAGVKKVMHHGVLPIELLYLEYKL